MSSAVGSLLMALCLLGFLLGSGKGVHALAPPDTAPGNTRVVTHPDWGGLTATQYLAALQTNNQYPDFAMAIDDTYDDLLSPWSEVAPGWASMEPVPMPPDPTAPPPPPTGPSSNPQYLFTADKFAIVGTSGDTLTATLTIAQSPTSTVPTTLQVVSAQLMGTYNYDGVAVANVPYSCAGAVCTFTWKNPSLDEKFWGQLTIQATVTSNNYPGTWVAFKDFYSSPTMAGKFTGQFTDSIVNGSLVINAGVQMYPNSYANPQIACTMSGNLYSVDNGWPLQHFEETMLLDSSTTSVPFTFFGKIFTDYGDAGTFRLSDLKAQCDALDYPAAWEMDPITHDADLDNWEASEASNPTPPYHPPFIYFGHPDYNYYTASYANSAFSSAPYQTPEQTVALMPDLAAFANAETAGTALNTATTDATGNTTYTNAAGGTDYLIFVHGRRNPDTCPKNSPVDTNKNDIKPEAFGVQHYDQCNLWAYKPDGDNSQTTATQRFVQWDAWTRYFNDGSQIGGHFLIHKAIRKSCGGHNECHFICHSAGCAALEEVLASLKRTHTAHFFNIANVIAAASAAGGSELAEHDQGLPVDSEWDGHYVEHIDKSLTPNYTRKHYNHNKMGVPIRAIAGTHLNNAWVELAAEGPLLWFPFQTLPDQDNVLYNAGCFGIDHYLISGRISELACVDDLVELHSGCGQRQRGTFDIFHDVLGYQTCFTSLRNSPDYDPRHIYDWHGYWLDDSENLRDTHIVGPFSADGKQTQNNWCVNNFTTCAHYNNYYKTHGEANHLATEEYTGCTNDNPQHPGSAHGWLCP